MLNLEKVGNKISTLRKEQNMKQNELADALYVTHQAVSKWENGKSIPSIEILYELTKLFNVSIDYLLDDSEILNDDYESLFRNYPRKVVIRKFLQKDNLNDEVEKIFYLLKNEERKILLDQIISKKVSISIKDIWHMLSRNERWYILNIIVSKKVKYDINKIYNQLNDLERQLVYQHHLVYSRNNRISIIDKEN